jgi:hypothetical protein
LGACHSEEVYSTCKIYGKIHDKLNTPVSTRRIRLVGQRYSTLSLPQRGRRMKLAWFYDLTTGLKKYLSNSAFGLCSIEHLI